MKVMDSVLDQDLIQVVFYLQHVTFVYNVDEVDEEEDDDAFNDAVKRYLLGIEFVSNNSEKKKGEERRGEEATLTHEI